MNVNRNRDKKSTVGAVIVAAGSSRRMGGEDKAFVSLGGEPLLAHVISVFEHCRAIDQIAVVVREDKEALTRKLADERGWLKIVEVCAGGMLRQESVKAGLELLNDCHWVVVHDGARPLVTEELIRNGLDAAAETGAAVAAVPVTDTIKVVGPDHVVRHTPSRDSLWAVQTPQVFRMDILKKAYRRLKEEVTDDATAVEHLGERVMIYRGSCDNVKITTADDLTFAETLWKNREK